MDPSDATLVARVLSGDESAYEPLVRRHFSRSYAVALALTGVPEDAEDVCQESFVRAYERLRECRSPDRFGAWLVQIVRHRAHNYRRYRMLRRTAALDDVRDPASAASPAKDAEIADLRRRLLTALQQLSPVQREVVVLHDLDGWPHAQIGRALGISEMMSRQHVSAARRKLRGLLAGTWLATGGSE